MGVVLFHSCAYQIHMLGRRSASASGHRYAEFLKGTERPHGSGHAGAGAMTDTAAVPAIAQPTEATSAPGAEAPPSSAAEPPKR